MQLLLLRKKRCRRNSGTWYQRQPL